jgi:hypothetical protein
MLRYVCVYINVYVYVRMRTAVYVYSCIDISNHVYM